MLSKLFAFFLILFIFCIPSRAHASEYFGREYAISYRVQENGLTNVLIQVTLTNKTSEYYASSDTIQLGFTHLQNVSANDPDGPITPSIKQVNGGSIIELPFHKRVVGKGNALKFAVSFNTNEIAKNQGSIWEINIPGIANPEEFVHFNVTVSVPESFGKPQYIKPSQSLDDLTFSKEQLGSSGISIAFGKNQFYHLNLTYHLQNNNLFPIRTEVALPPSTQYQQIRIDSIEPKPKNVTIDKDGNWLAEYLLLPSQEFDVKLKGLATVSLIPSGKETLDKEEKVLYTKPQQFWEADNDQIRQLAQKLKTPEAIYDFVASTLTYDFDRVTEKQPRLGAVKALKDPTSAVCLEFTDLFIAIARAAGIPAREVDGYAYTQNEKERPLSPSQDILHAWPEYYDQSKLQWIMVDPTWGNTTGGIDYFHIFDFDHIVFVRKGIDSKYPVPAGGYKFNGDENKKDVLVSFSEPFTLSEPSIELTPYFDTKYLSGLPIKGSITVTNTGSTLAKAQVVSIHSNTLWPNDQYLQLSELPPYASKELTVGFNKTPFLTNNTHTFTMSLAKQQKEVTLKVVPFSITKNQMIGGIGSGIFAISIFFIARKAWRLRVSR